MLHRAALVLLAAGLVVGSAACGSSGGGATSATSTPRGASTVALKPAGPNPSQSARMVCAAEARRDLRSALGVAPTTVTAPTWQDHVYSCAYRYPDGSFTLSVKELSDLPSTKAYFAGIGRRDGRAPGSLGFGQGAYALTNGSVVVRKDLKVMEVDVAALPARFGSPPLDRRDTATTIAITILGCWSGT